jgi:hypothetical protein
MFQTRNFSGAVTIPAEIALASPRSFPTVADFGEVLGLMFVQNVAFASLIKARGSFCDDNGTKE